MLPGTINHRQNKSDIKSTGRLGTMWLGNRFPSSLWVCNSQLIVQIAHRAQAALHRWPPMLTYPSLANNLHRDDVRPACSSNFAPNPIAEMSLQRAVLAGRRGVPRRLLPWLLDGDAAGMQQQYLGAGGSFFFFR